MRYYICVLILFALSCDPEPVSKLESIPHKSDPQETIIPLDPWEKYMNMAKEALQNQLYSLSEKYWNRAIIEATKQFSADEKMKKHPLTYYIADDYKELAKIYLSLGKFDAASKAENKYYELFHDKMEIYEVYIHHCSLEEIYTNWGKLDEAKKSVEFLDEDSEKQYKSAKDKSDQTIKNAGNPPSDAEHNQILNTWVKLNNASGHKLWTAYPAIGDYYIKIAEYDKAIQYLNEHVNMCVNDKDCISQNKAKAMNRLGMAYYYAGNDTEAEKLFGNAGGLNSRTVFGFPNDMALSCIMLGRIADHRGQADKALMFFQSARQAIHQYKKFDYTLEANIWNQIGRLQLKQGKIEESSNAYNDAVHFRTISQTGTHPNCADAYKGLADVSAYKGELTSATLYASKALQILDASVLPTHPRAAQELVALSSIHVLAGHPEMAAPLEGRLETILQKPLGPWKEDFLDTAAFYAGLLKKANKTPEAARLEQRARILSPTNRTN